MQVKDTFAGTWVVVNIPMSDCLQSEIIEFKCIR